MSIARMEIRVLYLPHLYNNLTAIQNGDKEDPFHWVDYPGLNRDVLCKARFPLPAGRRPDRNYKINMASP